jgi:hypothetical protein
LSVTEINGFIELELGHSFEPFFESKSKRIYFGKISFKDWGAAVA